MPIQRGRLESAARWALGAVASTSSEASVTWDGETVGPGRLTATFVEFAAGGSDDRDNAVGSQRRHHPLQTGPPFVGDAEMAFGVPLTTGLRCFGITSFSGEPLETTEASARRSRFTASRGV